MGHDIPLPQKYPHNRLTQLNQTSVYFSAETSKPALHLTREPTALAQADQAQGQVGRQLRPNCEASGEVTMSWPQALQGDTRGANTAQTSPGRITVKFNRR